MFGVRNRRLRRASCTLVTPRGCPLQSGTVCSWVVYIQLHSVTLSCARATLGYVRCVQLSLCTLSCAQLRVVARSLIGCDGYSV
eukprot:7938817-Pyramimonas_sp.AAC.2